MKIAKSLDQKICRHNRGNFDRNACLTPNEPNAEF